MIRSHGDLSNAQVFVQKTSGWFQFYLQAGAYNIPDLGVPFLVTGPTVTNLFGPFPVGYVKLVKENAQRRGRGAADPDRRRDHLRALKI